MEEQEKQHSRAKLLEMWKAARTKSSKPKEATLKPHSSSENVVRETNGPANVRSTMTAYYRNIFDPNAVGHNSKPVAATRPMVSPIRPQGAPIEATHKRLNAQPIPKPVADTSNTNNDAIFQSLAEKVSSLFPTPPDDSPPPTLPSAAAVEPGNNENKPSRINRNVVSVDTNELMVVSGDDISPRHRKIKSFALPETPLRVSSPPPPMSPATLTTDTTQLELECQALRTKVVEQENRIRMAVEEHHALNFVIEVQSQKIREYEVAISNSRLRQNEVISEKARKHKNEVRRLTKERVEYESQANTLIQQMTEQMNSLQTMAMARIDELETELMEERRKNSDLEALVLKYDVGRRGQMPSPKWKPYTHKDSVESSTKGSDDESEGTLKVDAELETVSKKSHLKRRETLVHVRSESKAVREDDTRGYLDEI